MLASVHNPLVKHLVKIRENRKYRLQHNSLLVSGFTVVSEIAASHKPNKIFVENLQDALPCPEIYQVSPAV